MPGAKENEMTYTYEGDHIIQGFSQSLVDARFVAERRWNLEVILE